MTSRFRSIPPNVADFVAQRYANTNRFRIPPEQRNQEVICDGELRIIDADSDKVLTDLPLQIVNSAAN